MTSPVVISIIAKNNRESVRIALDEFRGLNLIDIRVVAKLDDPSGGLVPTKKGVSLKIERLPELVAALQAAEAEARERGLLIDIEEEEAA
jgi:Transcriptional Coactivator p15 (PC4)